MMSDVIFLEAAQPPSEAAKWVSNHFDSNDHNQMKQTHAAIDCLSLSQVENHIFPEHHGVTHQWWENRTKFESISL